MVERSEFAPIDPQLSIHAQNGGFRVKREQLSSHVIPGSVFFLLEIGFELEGCFFLEYSAQEMNLQYRCTQIFKTSNVIVPGFSTSLASSSLW